MYSLIKKVLFMFDPEDVHQWVMNRLTWAYSFPSIRSWMRKKYSISHPDLERELWGIKFPNPVGLAAGFDKDAKYLDPLGCLGFGFVEIGTVTPVGQSGNDRPRLFRLPEDSALINRMGFNNRGATSAVPRIKKRAEHIVVGGNIGKNKETALDKADTDYEKCFEWMYKAVDYFVVNVSSPNTPGLRQLQDKQPLTNLLSKLMKMNYELGCGKPILLKIAPDLTNEQLDDIIDIVKTTGIHGIVATNTTISREGLHTSINKIDKIGAGGLSGMPLKERATEVVRYIHKNSNGSIPIIAVGGIFTAEDAIEKLEAGASLVQVYTGFIYEGPSIARKICEGLLKNGILKNNIA